MILPFGVGLLPLSTGVRLVIARLVLIFALPLDFHGRLRIVRSTFIPGALHGIEAGLRCGLLLLGLCGPVVSLLPILVRCLVCWMVRLVVTLRFALCGFGSVCCVGFLAFQPGEVSRVYRLLEHAADGCPGHGPSHLLVESAAEMGFVFVS